MKYNVLNYFKYVLYAGYILILSIAHPLNAIAQLTISGSVTDQNSGASLPGAHVSFEATQLQTVTDADGKFQLDPVKRGTYNLKVTFIGYKTYSQKIRINQDTAIKINLNGEAILGDEVNITATRAQNKYPSAYSSVSKEQISSMNLGKDIPYLLQKSPSVVVTSDAGNGIGYTAISIRGSDLTRINVTVNGIPLNDAESQGVWFVDLPDIASSTSDVQIQRGVGTSTNGAGAFGASINFMTSDLQQDPYGEIDLSGGSFNTFKSTLRFGTGLMKSKFSVDGRLSFIHSDGYIDRASSDLKSYYFAGGYYGKRTTLKFITFSGLENTYQAWNGVPKDSLATNRTYNSCGEYVDNDGNIAYYNNQVDHYQQDHYQLVFSQMLTKTLNINLALHYTKGKGYYENYEQDQSFADYGLNKVIIGNDTINTTDLVNRKMMDNDFFGLTFSSNYRVVEKVKLTIGGAWNRYYGQHFGKVIWAEYASNGNNDRNYYYNTGLKYDFNVYAKVSYQALPKLNVFADLQYRHVDYRLDGTVDDQRTMFQQSRFDFFNPKAGLFFSLTKNQDLWFSFGIANREPSRNDYKDAEPGKVPTNETLQDYELGYNFRCKNFTLGANLFVMNYQNQLVLTGEINNVGEAVKVNVPHSYRRGIELSAAIDLFKKLITWNLTTTFSRNMIKDFTQYLDNYDNYWNYLGQEIIPLGTTNLSFSPGIIFGSDLSVKPVHSLSITLTSKYVGKQYIDNTSSDDRKLNGYFVNGISASYKLKTKLFNEFSFNLAINNILNKKYESNAWVYPYLFGGNYAEFNGYFTQATTNFLFGISVKI